MLVYRSTVAAAMLAGALLVGCTDPDQPTDLRTDGPPNITAVTVMSDLETAADPNPVGIGRIVEAATYCRAGDDKRPGLVGLPDIRVIQVCPDDLTQSVPDAGMAEAAPPTWFARVVFDQLLDPSIEDLVPQLDAMGKPTGITIGTLKNTQPVTLTCNGMAVPYDGYYVPNGNRSSWPLGPALFIQPLSSTSVPTDASCVVSVKGMVHNKAGQPIPMSDQQPFMFKLAPMRFRFSSPDPSDGDNGKILQDPDTAVDFFWTAALKVAAAGSSASTLDPNQVKIFSGPNLNISASNADGDPDPAVCGTGGTPVDPALIDVNLRGTGATTTALVLRMDLQNGPTPATHKWQPNTTYRIQFGPNATVAAAQGGPDGTFPADYNLCFHTSASQM